MTKEQQNVKIVQKGNPMLRKKAEKVPVEKIKSKEIQEIIQKMKKALLESELGIAIAANQIGAVKSIFLVLEDVLHPERLSEGIKESEKNKKVLVFINPKIKKLSKKKGLKTEGCLSVEGVYGNMKRADKLTFEAYDEQGKKISRGASGLLAHVIQHEIDHLNGILFTDKATEVHKHKDHEDKK